MRSPSEIRPYQELPDILKQILTVLLRDWDYAKSSGKDLWDFAEDAASLHHLGAGNGDLKWLLLKGLVAKKDVPAKRGRGGRKVSAAASFVLTANGEQLARSLAPSVVRA